MADAAQQNVIPYDIRHPARVNKDQLRILENLHDNFARQLTPIEIGIINRIMKRVVEDLEATWEPILRVEISDIELEINPEFLQISPAQEVVILLAGEIPSE